MRRRHGAARSAAGPRPRRGLAVGVAAAAVAATLVVGGPDVVEGDAGVAPHPVVAGSATLDTTWYCPLGQSIPNGLTDGRIRVANGGASGRSVRLVSRSLNGRQRSTSLELAPWSVEEVVVSDLIDAKTAGVRVDVDGPGVVVEHSVLGSFGRSTALCHDTVSDHWVTAAGRTRKGDRLLLALYNPFPSPAIADITFATDGGVARPRAFSSVLVEGRALVVLDVSEHVLRQARVSAFVSVRAGRLVVDRIQEVRGARAGTALTPAVAAGSPTWIFPDGVTGDGLAAILHLANPGDGDAVIDVEVRSFVRGAASVAGEPRAVTVPAHDSVRIDVSELDGVVSGRPHTLVVRTLSGPDVVAEREVVASAPAPRRGRGVTVGATVAARRWLVGDGRVNAATDAWIVVYNPSTSEAAVRVVALVGGTRLDIEDLEAVMVPARGRRSVRLGRHLRRDVLALEITSTQPIVVQRDLFAVDAIGLSSVVVTPDPAA